MVEGRPGIGGGLAESSAGTRGGLGGDSRGAQGGTRGGRRGDSRGARRGLGGRCPRSVVPAPAGPRLRAWGRRRGRGVVGAVSAEPGTPGTQPPAATLPSSHAGCALTFLRNGAFWL